MPWRNKEDERAYWRRKNNDPVRRAKRRAYYRTPQGQMARRQYELLRAYGLSIAAYEALLASQDFRCAICRASDPGRGKGWNVDHCHKTLKVRGLLCTRCNFAVGHLKNDPSLCRATAEYLLRNS